MAARQNVKLGRFFDIVEGIRDKGISPDAVDRDKTALMRYAAVPVGMPYEITERMGLPFGDWQPKVGPIDKKTAIRLVVAQVSLLLDLGADPSAPGTGEHDGDTPLSEAASSSYPEVIELLLERGADPNAGNPLYRAALRGVPRIVSALLAAGARPDQKNKRGNTPLDVAKNAKV